MEEIDKCFVALSELQSQNSVLTNQTENNHQQSQLFTELETNNNQPINKLQVANLRLLQPEHVENGFLKEFLKQHFAKPTSLEQLLDELQTNLLQLKNLHSIVASFAPAADFESPNPSNGYRSMMKINDVAIRKLLLSLAKMKNLNAKNLKSQLYIIRLTVLVNLIQISWKAESDRLGQPQNEPNLFHQDTVLFWMDMFQEVSPYLGPYYINHLGFYLPKPLKKIYRIMIYSIATVHRLPHSLFLPLK